MKKILLVFLVMVLVLPYKLNAKDYATKNLKETLAAESLEEEFTNYTETDDQITIYMFRGQGCSYCRAFLTFLNGITNEYGKYFKLVTYEVWYDENNSALFKDVSTFMDGTAATGVPYIIIGNKAFGGYSSRMDDEMKEAIVNEYNKSKSERYNLFKELEASKNGSEEKSSTTASGAIILWNFIFTTISTVVVLVFVNSKLNKLQIKK